MEKFPGIFNICNYSFRVLGASIFPAKKMNLKFPHRIVPDVTEFLVERKSNL
jgi:hypothetical protein